MGLRGKHGRGLKILREIFKLNPLYIVGPKYFITRSLSYLLAQNIAEFVPRNAFISVIKDLKKLGAKRVDFIFQEQIPSGRPEGGISLDELSKYSWYQSMEKVRIEKIIQSSGPKDNLTCI
jgi:hypothetical protein